MCVYQRERGPPFPSGAFLLGSAIVSCRRTANAAKPISAAVGNRDAYILQDGFRISKWGNKTQPKCAGASPVHPLPCSPSRLVSHCPRVTSRHHREKGHICSGQCLCPFAQSGLISQINMENEGWGRPGAREGRQEVFKALYSAHSLKSLPYIQPLP